MGGVAEQLPRERAALSGHSCEVLQEVSLFSDTFAFNIFGAPSVWFYRVNMPGMRYFHHSALDDLPVVSAHQIALTATVHLTYQAAFNSPPWPRSIPEDQAAQVTQYAGRFCGL